ncbi:MAG: hypothetical protein GHCLOJNM_01980 [bacterium]|nr:hypothetical protein [bacterium]
MAYVRQIDTPPFSDMADYEAMALNLLEGRGLIMSDLYKAYRPPLYPLMIAGVYRFFGTRPDSVLLIQCVLSALTVALAYLFTFHLFQLRERGRQAPQEGPTPGAVAIRARSIALVAAALLCFEEATIFFCGQLLTETLFTFLFVTWAYLTVKGATRPSLGWATLIGIVGGAAILTRPNFAPLVLAGAYWFFLRSRRHFSPPPPDWHRFSFIESPYAPPLVMVTYAFLVVSLWTIRNQTVLDQFVLVSTNGGVNFYLGHHEDFGYASFGDKEGIRMRLRERGSYDEVLESKIFTLIGLQFIRSHPWETVKNTFKKVYYLYLAPATALSAVEPWTWWSYLDCPYRPWPWETQRRQLRFWPVFDSQGEKVMPTYKEPFWREGRLPLVFWGWPLIYLSMAGMIWCLARRETTGFLFLVILVYTLMLLVYFTNARFRAPLLPFLFPFAAYTLVEATRKLRGKTA